MLTLIAWSLIGLALAGCFATLASAVAVRGFRGDGAEPGDPPADPSTARVTLLKPLHGAEPGLYDNLRSFIEQDYTGPVQIVFGVSGATDGAVPIVRRLIDEYPHRDLELVVGRPSAQGNAKVANLVSMSGVIRHDFVVLSDSDMRVGPRYLQRIVTALSHPDVGLVTYLYRGEWDRGLWAMLSTMAIDYHFLPSVLLGLMLRKAQPCMGATMAFTGETLAAIGGFNAFASCLADDYAIGAAVRATGRRVTIGTDVIVHRCTERTLRDLFLHELRWARTLRSIDPLGFNGSFVTNPLPFAVLATCFGGFEVFGLSTLGFTIFCRLLLQQQIERTLDVSTRRWLLSPARDAFSFFVFCASYLAKDVVWRGQRFRVSAEGNLENLEGSRS